MRRIIIDQARKKKAIKHGGDLERVDVHKIDLPSPMKDDRLLDMNEALERFELMDAPKAELIKLRYFAGLRIDEATKVLEVSVPTANRWWTYAKAWMYREMTESRTVAINCTSSKPPTVKAPK